MSKTQKIALNLMAEDNRGAVLTKFGWIFPTHIRDDRGDLGRKAVEMAEEVIKNLAK